MHGGTPFRHSNHVLFQHILPILLKERVAAAQRGQRFQIQKRLKNLMNPDIVGHLIDPSGRRQEGAAWKGRSEGCHRDFLALGGWRRGGTAGTSGSAVRFGGHLSEEAKMWRTLSLAPEYFGWKMDNDGRRIDTEFNGNSTRCHSNTFDDFR